MHPLLQTADYRLHVAQLYREVKDFLDAGEPEMAHVHWMAGRTQLWRTHPFSPVPESLRPDWSGLEYWDYDPRYAFAIEVPGSAPLEGSQEAEVARTQGASGPIQGSRGPWGRVIPLGEANTPLGPVHVGWIDQYGGGFFAGIRDATNGTETYGGGRYVLDSAKGAYLGTNEDGLLRFDLNFAYHPSCARSPKWNCPLPMGMPWSARVEAGEKLEQPAWGDRADEGGARP